MLTIDDREPVHHPHIVLPLRSRIREHRIARLEFGDYAFLGYPNESLGRPVTVGIELCTPSDLCGKLGDGRLVFQLSGLLEKYDTAILMIDGTISPNKDGYVFIGHGIRNGVKYERLMDTLFAAQSHGLIFRQTTNVVDAIDQTMRYWSKPPEEHTTFRSQPWVTREATMSLAPEINDRVGTLMTLPGIGEQRAIDLLKMFGSVGAIANMPPSMLAKVPGIGHGTAHKIHEYINAYVDVHTPEVRTDLDALPIAAKVS